MVCTEWLAGRMSQLSLQDPSATLKSMIALHQDLISALQQANVVAAQGDSAGSVLSEFQRITGCRRTEALFYLKQSSNDIRAAVAVWHSQVLEEFLSTFQQEQPHLQTYLQHSVKDAAEQMRSKAQKAAAAAAAFEQGMAQNYLRTNFCSICRVERDTADVCLQAADFNLVAAVDEYIARHMLPPVTRVHPNIGRADSVLVSRNSSWSSNSSAARAAAAAANNTTAH